MNKELKDLQAKLSDLVEELDPKLQDVVLAQLKIIDLIKVHFDNLDKLKEEFMKPVLVIPGENDRTGRKVKLTSKPPNNSKRNKNSNYKF